MAQDVTVRAGWGDAVVNNYLYITIYIYISISRHPKGVVDEARLVSV